MDPILYKSAVEGDIEVLRQNADQLEVQVTPNNNKVLHVAAQFGQTQCVAEILQKCSRSLLCSVNIKGETSLYISAREGHTGIVQALIEYGKTLDKDLERGNGATMEMLRMRNVEGDTALYEAVRNNHLDVVEILTKEDPEFLHFSNNAKETPLYLAAERRYPAIVFQILENCISPAYIGPNERTALHAATISYDKECIRILYSRKPSLIKEADMYGWRPLHYVAWLGHVLAVRQLLDLDKSVAYLVTNNDDNLTALHIAASQGHVDVMEELISHCPDCWEMINSRGQNILHIAAEHEQNKMIVFILANSFVSSLINQKDINGNTPHLVAASFSFFEYSPLYDHPRVDRRACNKKNLTALEIKNEDIRPNLVAKVGCRNKFKLEKRKKTDLDLTKLADTHLIVATLIATVTFAAGFTIPGGYDGSQGPKQGMAVLTRQTAFQVFVLTDTIAMVFSVSAVILHLFASFYDDWERRAQHYFYAFLLIIAAVGAMAVAFTTGFYAVLAYSVDVATIVWVGCCLFLPTFCYVLNKCCIR